MSCQFCIGMNNRATFCYKVFFEFMEESRRPRMSAAQFDYLISPFPLVGPVLLEERRKKKTGIQPPSFT